MLYERRWRIVALGTKIEWTEATWNPVTGCSKYSDGCKNCYAECLALRLQAMGNPKYRNGFKLTLHPQSLKEPLSWKKPHMIFVPSMGDLFHEDVPVEFIKKVFDTMNKAYWHIFQVLTKRAERLAEVAKELPWPPNVWAGVTVESVKYTYRISLLRKVPAKIRFLSLEPLLSDMPSLDLTGINWVIVGGESGPGARPMQPVWVRHVRDQCKMQGVKFFFKQWGGVRRRKSGRIFEGRTWNEMPSITSAQPTLGMF